MAHYILTCVILILSFTKVSYGQESYQIGIKQLNAGDYVNAETSLLDALKISTSSSQKAKAHAALGICQFLLGDQGTAKKSIEQALTIASNFNLDASEISDKDAIKFFEQTKTNFLTNQTTQVQKKEPIKVVEIKKEKSPPSPQVVSNKTYLKINSKQPHGSVYVDGRLIGEVNQAIEIDLLGSINIEVKSHGYFPLEREVVIERGKINEIRVSLLKEPPKSPFKPVPPNTLPQKTAQPPTVTPAQPTPQPSAVVTKPQPVAQNTKTVPVPQKKENLTDEKTKEKNQQPKKNETQEAKNPEPQPPEPEVNRKNIKQESDAVPEAKVKSQNKNSFKQVKVKEKKKDKEKEKEYSKNQYIVFLPFGAGQYQNKNYFLGGLFSVTQLVSLIYYYQYNKKIGVLINDSNRYLDQRLDEERSKTGEEKIRFSQETDDKLSDKAKEIDATKQKALTGIISFTVLWGLSITEALLNQPQNISKKTVYFDDIRDFQNHKTSTKILPNLAFSEHNVFPVVTLKTSF